MIRTARLIFAAIPILCAALHVAQADLPPVTEVVSFGDSLSDCGAYGFRPTTAPSAQWNQLVAKYYGFDLQPNETGQLAGNSTGPETQPGGLCYAQGGARATTGTAGQPEKLPISGAVQLDHFLAQHNDFTSNQLVTVYLGTNDILIRFATLNAQMAAYGDAGGQAAALAAVRLAVEQSAKDVGRLIQRMLDHKAKRVAVLNIYDLGLSGFPSANPVLSGLVDDFNRTLSASLPRDPRVQPVDTHALFAAIAAHPGKYGITHPLSDDACATPTRLGPDCYADSSRWKSPDADRTHLFVGMVHFTAATELLLAEYVIRQIDRGRHKN
ncbi:MAG: putative secreted phospholipase [Rhodospirillales bacterium]|nr:putative secreted phospholipase [Rhodospirillales bacterium]